MMAVVLFLSWQLMGSGSRGDDGPDGAAGAAAGTVEPPGVGSAPDAASAAGAPEDTAAAGNVTGSSPASAALDSAASTPDTAETAPDTACVAPADTSAILSDTTVTRTPAERTITVLVLQEGEPIVEAGISTSHGGIVRWELPGYEAMPGLAGGGSVSLAAGPWLRRQVTFVSDSPDTVVVEDGNAVVGLEGPGGETVEYRFSPGFYGFEVASSGLGQTTAIEAGVIPVTEQDVGMRGYFQAQWNADKVRSERAGGFEEVRQAGNVLWIATRSKYFGIIVMPSSYERTYAYAYPGSEETSPAIALQDPAARIYAGPLDYRRLRELGEGTGNIVDFGWPVIREIGKLLFWFSTSVIAFVGNWGLKIIVLSVVLKLVLLPLTTKSFRSMQKLREIQPRMKEIQAKFKSDPKAQQEALQKLYREEGVNPLGGCLPLLMQMPVFFALYRVLANSVQLRGAPFMLWIQDLSRPEILIPFDSPLLGLHGIGILAVLMGAAMFVQQKMTMTDQGQKGMLYLMPVFMTFLFMRFPAGLTLYWFTNNLLTIGQQELIKKKLEREAGRAS